MRSLTFLALGLMALLLLIPNPCHSTVIFNDVNGTCGISFSYDATPFGGGVTFYDLDGDLDLDIYFCDGDGRPNRLFLNDGNFGFSEVLGAWGTADPAGRSRTAAFADYDNDGDPDLMVSRWLQPNLLYRNDGPEGFVEVSVAAGMSTYAYSTCGVAWGDLNGDGYLDIFMSPTGAGHPTSRTSSSSTMETGPSPRGLSSLASTAGLSASNR